MRYFSYLLDSTGISSATILISLDCAIHRNAFSYQRMNQRSYRYLVQHFSSRAFRSRFGIRSVAPARRNSAPQFYALRAVSVNGASRDLRLPDDSIYPPAGALGRTHARTHAIRVASRWYLLPPPRHKEEPRPQPRRARSYHLHFLGRCAATWRTFGPCAEWSTRTRRDALSLRVRASTRAVRFA